MTKTLILDTILFMENEKLTLPGFRAVTDRSDELRALAGAGVINYEQDETEFAPVTEAENDPRVMHGFPGRPNGLGIDTLMIGVPSLHVPTEATLGVLATAMVQREDAEAALTAQTTEATGNLDTLMNDLPARQAAAKQRKHLEATIAGADARIADPRHAALLQTAYFEGVSRSLTEKF